MQIYFWSDQSICKTYISYILGSDVGGIPWKNRSKGLINLLRKFVIGLSYRDVLDLEAAWAVYELNKVRFKTNCLHLGYKFYTSMWYLILGISFLRIRLSLLN